MPWSVEPAREPFLHPGRSARVLIAGEPAGWIGELHPGVAAAWDLDQVAAFEVELDAVLAAAPPVPVYRDVTSFPSVRQDRAWWFPREVSAAQVLDVVRDAGGALLRACRCSTSTRARTACRWRCGWSSARPTAR